MAYRAGCTSYAGHNQRTTTTTKEAFTMKTKQKLIDKSARKCIKAYRQARKAGRGKAWAITS